jgi:hypothetical protein
LGIVFTTEGMSMIGIRMMCAVAALTLSGAAVAGPAWTYADLGVFIGDSSGKDEETQGLALRGSYAFADMWHVQAELASGEVGGGKSETGGADVTAYGIRGGIHPSITENTDLVLDLGYSNVEMDFGGSKPDADAIDIRTGVRSNLGPVELRAFVSLGFFDGDGSNDEGRDIAYAVGGQYNFSPAWAVGTDITVSDSDDLIDIFVRWNFGTN